MATDDEHSTLRRKLHEPKAAEDAGAPLRKLLVAVLLRAGEACSGLRLTCHEASQQAQSFEEMLAGVPSGGLYLLLAVPNGPAGLLFVDPVFLDALVQVQTTGRVVARDLGSRAPTATDATLAENFVTAFLATLTTAAKEASFPALANLSAGARLGDMRAVGLALKEGPFERTDIAVDVMDGALQGKLILCLPEQSKAAKGAGGGTWAQALGARVIDAQAQLVAVLSTRMMSVAEAGALKPGDSFPIPRTALADVVLRAGDGKPVARGRLGQMNGQRAMRLTVKGADARQPHHTPPAGAEVMEAQLPASPQETPAKPSAEPDDQMPGTSDDQTIEATAQEKSPAADQPIPIQT